MVYCHITSIKPEIIPVWLGCQWTITRNDYVTEIQFHDNRIGRMNLVFTFQADFYLFVTNNKQVLITRYVQVVKSEYPAIVWDWETARLDVAEVIMRISMSAEKGLVWKLDVARYGVVFLSSNHKVTGNITISYWAAFHAQVSITT